MIVRSPEPVTLVGGGDLGMDDLATALSRAPALVAADGGAAALLAAGLVPLAVIGDMDSIPPDAAAAFGDRLHRVPEQETTDFDKALRGIAAPLIIAIGFTGGQMDHALAALHSLVVRPQARCVILGGDSLTFLCPPVLALDLPPGTRLSLFPLGPVMVAAQGLLWPTDGLRFAPDSRIGTSNAVAGPVLLRPDAARMLVILPRGCLDAATMALTQAPEWAAQD